MLARYCIRRFFASRVVPYLSVRHQSAASQLVEPVWEETAQIHQQSDYDAPAIAEQMKRRFEKEFARKRRKIERDARFLPEGSNDEILEIEVSQLLAKVKLGEGRTNTQNGNDEKTTQIAESEFAMTFAPFQQSSAHQIDLNPPAELEKEVELEIVYLSSTGDGLAYNEAKDHIIVVPFSVPGDRVLAKVWKWEGRHSLSDFLKIIRPAPIREGITPRCQYFTQCSGCQLQMLPYEEQLEHKRQIVRKAFQNFSGLKSGQIPDVEPTMGSPLQYEYRTKLTPHFDGPKRGRGRSATGLQEPPLIGYNMKGKRQVLDIESCPIGTDILQEGLKFERAKVLKNYASYKNGATILLRESTRRDYEFEADSQSQRAESPPPSNTTEITQPSQSLPSDPLSNLLESKLNHNPTTGEPTITTKYPTHFDFKTYTSDSAALTTEYITVTTDAKATPPTTRTYKFTNIAGSFFQNNNSILGPFTSYIYSLCIPSSPSSDIKYLLDAYSGSGLFTITLSPLFVSSLGIDVDARSIAAARANAHANALPESSCGFVDADAAALFADVPYPPDQTVCVIDPPRKGCDRAFLKQLRRFGPTRVVYVSCNVHSQARDVGVLVNGFGGRDAAEERDDDGGHLWKYEIESVRGCDFFPQTGHVEGVCVLNRVGKAE